MNILSMLVRLEDTLGRTNLAKQMVLLPQIGPDPSLCPVSTGGRPRQINLVVGYDGSPNSQTALDLTLWIAHQTRLATRHQVTVQVVYVVDLEAQYTQVAPPRPGMDLDWRPGESVRHWQAVDFEGAERSGRSLSTAIAELPHPQDSLGLNLPQFGSQLDPQMDQFDHADRILWQARQMADEWRGSLKTHLRFGRVAQELRRVVNAESASLLLLGCTSADNPMVEQLGLAFPCAVLGIPPCEDAA